MKQWQSLMAAEEKRAGLPAGMLASLVQQETGGQQRFIDNPADFHYKAGPNGEKPKSSARGLGGILEATARDPGYGVAPLKDWSAPEQLRFMADYTKARIKQAGSVEGGLAGYGEGAKYAKQVAGRIGKQAAPGPVQRAPEAVVTQQAMVAPDVLPMQAAPAVVQAAALMEQQVPQQLPPVVVAQQQASPWDSFKQRMPTPELQVADINFQAAPAFVRPTTSGKDNVKRMAMLASMQNWLGNA